MTAALVVVATATVLGAGLLRAVGIGLRTDRLAFWGWSYLAGTLGLGTLSLAWFALGKPAPGAWLGPVAALIGVGAWFGSRPVAAAEPVDRSGERFVLYAAVALVAWAVVDAAIAATALPISTADEGDIWSAKAKVMFTATGAAFGETAALFVSHADYPNLNPLLQLAVFEHAGAITHAANRLPIQAFQLALALVLAAALRRFVRPSLAAALVVLVFATDDLELLATMAYSDPMVMLGMLVAVDSWLRWRRTGEPAHFRLATLGLAFALFAKNEGIVLGLVWLLAVAIARATRSVDGPVAPRGLQLAWLAVPIALVGAQTAFNAAFGFRNDLFEHDRGSFVERLIGQAPERFDDVFGYAWNEILLSPDGTRLVFLLTIGLLLAFPLRLRRTEFAAPAAFVVGALLAYQLVFLASPHKLSFHLPTASVRVALHAAPISLLATAIALGELVRWLRPGFSAGAPGR